MPKHYLKIEESLDAFANSAAMNHSLLDLIESALQAVGVGLIYMSKGYFSRT